jgi:hypothetical protein
LVYAQRSDRLTSRLEGLIGSWRVARGLGRPTVFFWPKPYGYEEGDYSAASIFDLRSMARSPDSRDLKIAERRTGLRKDALHLRAQPGWPDALDRHKLMAQKSHIFIQAMHTMEFKGEHPDDIEEERKSLFRLLLPHPIILEKLEKAIGWIGEGPFTAVHIRRGDVVDKLTEALAAYPRQNSEGGDPARAEERLGICIGNFIPRWAPIEAYVARVRRSDPNRRILVFSDSPTAAEEFQRALPERDVRRFSFFAAPLTELQRSWLEVLVLMRAQEIVSTQSTYGLFASRYGGVPFTPVHKVTDGNAFRSCFFQYYGPSLRESPRLQRVCARLVTASIRREVREYYWMAFRRFSKRLYCLLRPKQATRRGG